MSVRTFALALSAAAVALTGPALLTVPAPAAPAATVSAPTASLPMPRWGPVKPLTANPRGAALAVDARSTVTVVWATSSWPGSIVALRRPAGGPWGDPEVIGRGSAPQVEVDARGNVTVVWLTQRRGFTDGVATARRAGGRWSDPVRLSRDLSVPGYRPGNEGPYGAVAVDLAVSPSGAAGAVWSWGSDDRAKPWRIQSARRSPAGPWGDAIDVTPASGANFPQVGLGADGAGTLVYGRQRLGHPRVLKSRLLTASGRWSDAAVVAAEGYDETLSVDRAGNALVVFTPDFNRVYATRRPVGSRWRAARPLSPEGVAIGDFASAMNGRGRALVALGRGSGRVDLLQRAPHGSWSLPVRVARPGTTVYNVVAALDGAGDTFVGWGGNALYGKYRPQGGGWSDRFTISPDAGVEVLEEVHAEVAPNGDVVVLWDQEARPLKVRVMTGS